MSRRIPSPSMAVALLALVISAGTSGAVAANLITSQQVKNHSLKAADIKRDGLGGETVNESKLAKVPTAGRADSAATADALAGLAPDAFLRSDRVLSGAVPDPKHHDGALVLRDPATGLEVHVNSVGEPTLRNTNQTAVLSVRGIGYYATNVYSDSRTIAAGTSSLMAFDATGFTFAHLFVLKKTTDGTAGPRLDLTCAFDFDAANNEAASTFSCTGLR